MTTETTAPFDRRSSDEVFAKQPCAFCQIMLGELQGNIWFHDDHVVGMLTHAPLAEGHSLIIPARHHPFLSTLPEETGRQIWTVGQRTAAALKASGLKCEGVHFRLVDGVGALQNVPHVHLHVVPRWKGDGGFAAADSKVIRPHEELEQIRAIVQASYRKLWGAEGLL